MSASVEYGLWTEGGGGFVETQLYSLQAAQERLAEYIRESDDPESDREDLQVIRVCPDHEGQPRVGCQDCRDEEE